MASPLFQRDQLSFWQSFLTTIKDKVYRSWIFYRLGQCLKNKNFRPKHLNKQHPNNHSHSFDGDPPDTNPAMIWIWQGLQENSICQAPPSGEIVYAAISLYARGLSLSEPEISRRALETLFDQAQKNIQKSGLWSDNSIFIHLQMSAAYSEAWLYAHQHHRSEQRDLEAIVRRLIAVLDVLRLPGGLPAIGTTHDYRPIKKHKQSLLGLIPKGPREGGWLDDLTDDQRHIFLTLRESLTFYDWQKINAEGWVRFDLKDWSSLFHIHKTGYLIRGTQNNRPYDEHDHMGSGEIHYKNSPIFIDPGDGISQDLTSPFTHNSLSLDGYSSLMTLRPNYNNDFIKKLISCPPVIQTNHQELTIKTEGFSGLGGIRFWKREWQFYEESITLEDKIIGTGHRHVQRILVTKQAVSEKDGSVILNVENKILRISGEGQISITSRKGIDFDGNEFVIKIITFESDIILPWTGQLTMKWIDDVTTHP